MDKTSSRIPAVPALTPDALERALHAVTFLSRVAFIPLAAHRIAPSAWRARRDPAELAVVAGPCALLAAQFECLHRAERLARAGLATRGAAAAGGRRLGPDRAHPLLAGVPGMAGHAGRYGDQLLHRAHGLLPVCAPPRPGVPQHGRIG
ncbi:hypothetical protein SETIT_3G106900v2 [Setaria italica]|nr:hypothetical protein SETIT_3G106900v2 [Setaria italica]